MQKGRKIQYTTVFLRDCNSHSYHLIRDAKFAYFKKLFVKLGATSNNPHQRHKAMYLTFYTQNIVICLFQ
jgi:hypothetical protein